MTTQTSSGFVKATTAAQAADAAAKAQAEAWAKQGIALIKGGGVEKTTPAAAQAALSNFGSGNPSAAYLEQLRSSAITLTKEDEAVVQAQSAGLQALGIKTAADFMKAYNAFSSSNATPNSQPQTSTQPSVANQPLTASTEGAFLAGLQAAGTIFQSQGAGAAVSTPSAAPSGNNNMLIIAGLALLLILGGGK